jgi:DNA-binding XRE family transcriptional regulator
MTHERKKEIDSLFSERLAKFRIDAGLTQQKLHKLSGITLQTIRGLEDGLWGPSLATAVCLANALKVSLEAFIK